MAEKNIVQLIKKFDLEGLKPVVVVYGTENFLKKQFVEKLKKTADTHIFWGDETDYLKLKEVFSSSSLFSEGNVAVLLDGEQFFHRLGKEQIKDFLELAKNLSLPDRLFILINKEKLPAKEPFKTLKNTADIIVSPPLTPKAFYISVKNKIEKSGKKIGEEALKKLVNRLKGDLYYAKQEIEKLLTYIGDREEITVEDVEKVVVPKTMENVFVFLDSFFKKEPSALKIYRQLVNSTHHPFEIQSLLLTQINRLLLLKTVVSQGKSYEVAFNRMGVKHPAVKGTLQKQAGMVSKRELVNLLKELYRLEKEQKVEYADLRRSAEDFILRWIVS
ncbi:MAG: DNA polymerase III subunit delta [Aquificae bacterium]|nr:DNA polymerase III subunit delta [Aquificota bacterium]